MSFATLDESTRLGVIETVANERAFSTLRRQGEQCGWCAHPIRLTGYSMTVDSSTGEVLSRFSTAEQPGGVLLKACGTRRASRCGSCARLYASDARQLVRAGLVEVRGSLLTSPLDPWYSLPSRLRASVQCTLNVAVEFAVRRRGRKHADTDDRPVVACIIVTLTRYWAALSAPIATTTRVRCCGMRRAQNYGGARRSMFDDSSRRSRDSARRNLVPQHGSLSPRSLNFSDVG